ncbi:MAG: FCD domain-containing protein [Propionibacterium sp.]|nr:FCD domain-containing protein [Propionibacterium sp.]
MGAPTLHQAIVESVAQHILSGEIQPGEVLTLTWIQEEYGVSRTVARETARVLESVGLLEARRKVGLVVRPQSEWSALHPRMVRWMMQGGGHLAELRALTELRLAVEPVAASAAATLATSEQREELKALARRLYQLADRADSQDFLEADIRFHALLLEASGNPIFVSLKGALAENTARTRRLGADAAGGCPDGDHRPRPCGLAGCRRRSGSGLPRDGCHARRPAPGVGAVARRGSGPFTCRPSVTCRPSAGGRPVIGGPGRTLD